MRNVVLLFGGQAASWGFALLWLVFVPRKLGPTVIGELTIATSVTALLGIFVTQGAGTLLTREIARDSAVAGRLVSGTLVMRLLCFIPAFVVASFYSWLLRLSGEQTVLIWLATGGMLTASLSGALQAAFAGLERMEYMSYANIVGNGLTCVLGIGLVLSGGGPVALLGLELALTALVLVLNLVWAARLFDIGFHGALRTIPFVVRGGLSYWIGGLFFVAYLWIDSVLLSIMAPAKVVGWYGAPTQLFAAILMVTGVLGTAWFPRLAAAHIEGESRLRQVGKPAVEAVVVFSLPIAIGVILVAGPLVELLAGRAFSGAVPVLMLLGVSVIPTSFNMIVYQILAASNRQVAWIKVVAIATVLNIALNLVLVPRFQMAGNGAIGSATALLISELFECACAVALLPWLLRGSSEARVLRAAAATALMAATVLLVAQLGVIVQITAGVVSFLGFAYLLRVASKEELLLLRAVSSRLRRRAGAAAV